MLDFSLSEEQELVKEAIARAVQPFLGRLEQIHHQIHVDRTFPPDLLDALCETGLLGTVIPPEYGGNGMGLLAGALGIEKLTSFGINHVLLILTMMDAACMLRMGSEDLKQRYLPKMATGALKFGFALTETDAGSNAFRIRTHAKKDGDAYVVNGAKVFITGADVADRILLVARTTTREECEAKGLPKAHGLSLFVLDPKAKGVDLKIIPTHGIEGMSQFMVHLDDVRVPAEDLVGPEDQGAMALFLTLNPERILAAAAACGAASFVLKKAARYANERKVFRDQPIGAYQSIAHPLAKVHIQLEAARLLTYRAAWAFDREDLSPATVGNFANMAKYTAAEMGIDAIDRAIQTHGGYGFSEEYGLIYHWTSMRLLRTAPISAEMILNFIAEHELGLPRSY